MCRQWRWQGQRLARELLARIRPESQSRHSSSRTISSLICEQVFLLACYVSSGSFPGRVRVICQKAATIEHNFDSPDGVPATSSYENRSWAGLAERHVGMTQRRRGDG